MKKIYETSILFGDNSDLNINREYSKLMNESLNIPKNLFIEDFSLKYKKSKHLIKDNMKKIEITIASIVNGKKLYAYLDALGRTMYQIWE